MEKSTSIPKEKRSVWIYLACFSTWLGAVAFIVGGIALLPPSGSDYSLYVLMLSGCLVLSVLGIVAGWGIWRMKRWGVMLYLSTGIIIFSSDALIKVSEWKVGNLSDIWEIFWDSIGVFVSFIAFVIIFIEIQKIVSSYKEHIGGLSR